ncbi:GGDEF domain-containing protein [Acinetobacter sp. MD2(2019)]|uniref:GGDEF domain-containing protein n=1 Tax=Acinetobacter sp. MD2(2019) TaxID=2605273 RepID=UPI002D1ECF71|nr:GGDEF domain-containing protein [Acinetobacter sp. MD2(2019)]MEB3753146.1 GGDEF domain-containing protein [Acinetobacter sp. MD2(2019)]
MRKIILLWLSLFILAALTLAITAQFMISPIWVVNVVAAYYCIRYRKQLHNFFIMGLFSASAIFVASLLFDHYQELPQKLLLSLLSGLQVSLFVWVYYLLIQRLDHHYFKYRQTILLTVPNLVSSFIAAWLFVLIPKQGESYLEFLDYFLEQASTGLAVICLLVGHREMKRLEFRDYLVLTLALVVQYFISISHIFYNCFIIPIVLLYFAIRYSVIRFSYIVGLVSLICATSVSIPLAGQFWQADEIHFLSRLSVYRTGIAMSIILYVLMCEIRNLNKRLYLYVARISFQDELTGLKNRRFMREKILQPNHLQQGLLLLIDIDDFKKINDQYGHQIGDIILNKFARLLEQIMPEHAQVFRWGGEEFLVMVDSVSNSEQANALCQHLIEHTKNVIFNCDGIYIQSSLSAGVVQFEQYSEDNYHQIIDRADQLLYQAKAQGKQCYVLAW